MSQSQEQDEAVPRNLLVERSPIIVGIVGAIIALVSLVGLPWQLWVTANGALAWLSMAFVVLAIGQLERGRRNRWSIVAIVVGLAAFAFWIIAPETIAPLPMYAYIVTALVHLGLGLLLGRMDPARGRTVYIALGGAVVFTAVTAFSRFGM